MQLRNRLDRCAAGGVSLDGGKAKLERGKGLVMPAGGVVFLPEPQPMRGRGALQSFLGFGARGRGGHRACGRHGNYPCVSEGNRTMKIFGKQSLVEPGAAACARRQHASGCFGRLSGNIE